MVVVVRGMQDSVNGLLVVCAAQLLDDAAELIEFLQVPALRQGERRQLESIGMPATKSLP